MFPIRDNIPARHFPAATLWLIIVNVLAFLYEMRIGEGLPYFFSQYGFVPARLTGGAIENKLPVLGTVFTSMFLHGNLLHLFSNMWMLWVFGDNVEDRMGHGRYLIFYTLCGVFAVVLQTIVWPDSHIPLVGASGAISGVLGAYFILYPRARILTFIPLFFFFYLVEIPAFFFLGWWFLLQFLQGYFAVTVAGAHAKGGGIAWWAHIGGFAAGFVLLKFFVRNKSALRSPFKRIFR